MAQAAAGRAGCGRATRRCGPASDEAKWLGWLRHRRRAAGRPAGAARVPGRGEGQAASRMSCCSAWAAPASGRRCWRETFGSAGRLAEAARARQHRSGPDREPSRTRSIWRTRCSSSSASRAPRWSRTSAGTISSIAMQQAVGDKAGQHFVAVTDPGSKLETVAKRDGFAHIFYGDPTIGGRYSVLSEFGMVPAAAIGIDVERVPRRDQRRWCDSCGAGAPPAANPGVQLGCVIGAAATAGRDKVTIVASPGIADSAPGWSSCSPRPPASRARASSRSTSSRSARRRSTATTGCSPISHSTGEPDAAQDARRRRARGGRPAGGAHHARADTMQIGQEFFRWEIATAVAGAVIGINPFDQPDVEASKIETRKLTDAYEKTGTLPAETPFFEDDGIKLFADARMQAAARRRRRSTAILKAHFAPHRSRRLCRLAGLYRAQRGAHRGVDTSCAPTIRDAKHVATVRRVRPALPALDRPGLQGRPEQRRVPADHLRRPRRTSPVPGENYTLRHGQGGAGARRFRRAGRARPAGAARPSQGRTCDGLAR